jgi:SPP1 family predicted phage head-tail adaptor
MSGFSAGDLDRRITFQRRAAGAGDFMSAGKSAWETVATVWAQVADVLPSRGERAAEGVTIANRPARIRMRFRPDITADMRIIYGNRTMQIVAGPAELGRRVGLELMAEDYSTAGQPA